MGLEEGQTSTNTSLTQPLCPEIARAVFGGKCADKARAVANADAGVDAFNHGIGWGAAGSVVGFTQFVFHGGEAWAADSGRVTFVTKRCNLGTDSNVRAMILLHELGHE